MSAIFGFNQAAAVAGWLAFLLVPISRHNIEDARVWYEDRRNKLDLWWAPSVMFFPIFWAIMYAVLTVTIFYFTQVVAGDTWQFITGFTMFVTHVIMLKLWESVFWEARSPGGGVLVFLGLYGTGAVFLVCCIVDQSGLYLVPTLLFSAYLLVLIFPAALNWAIAFPKGIRMRWGTRSHHRKSSQYGDIRAPLSPNK